MSREKAPKYMPKEMAEMEKQRTLSDAELLEGGVRYKVNKKGESELVLNEKQIKNLDYGVELKTASIEVRADKNLVMNAVRQDGFALEFASAELKSDKEVVFEAIKNSNGYALKFASPELRADKNLVLAAVELGGEALEYASSELRGDKDVVLKALSRSGFPFQFASPKLRADKKVVMKAVRGGLKELGLISENLQRDPDVREAERLKREKDEYNRNYPNFPRS